MTYTEAFIIAVVEGITEFLPVSSTAHMVLAATLLKVDQSEDFVKLFEISIQFGAILSVLFLYRDRFLSMNWNFLKKLIIGVLPALVFGALFKSHIDNLLEKPVIIAMILGLGGILFLFVEKWLPKPHIHDVDTLLPKQALIIGFAQVLAIILPGFSRSAATLLGGMFQGMNKKSAAEFSFFLAIPTMSAATAKSALDYFQESSGGFGTSEIQLLLFGNIIAFIVAIFAIKALVTILHKYGLAAFGYYRIIAASIFLFLVWKGLVIVH